MKEKILSSYELIKALCDTFGPSGCEDAVAELIKEQVAPIAESITTDKLGNVIAKLPCASKDNNNNKKKLMISAHMDEVGFMISRVCDDGYLKISEIGGINGAVLAGRHVCVGDELSQINGVIASKAIHQKKSEDRLKADKIDKLYIDIGADSAEKAAEYANVGTFATFAPNFARFGKDGRYISSKALDDRLGCALIIELMRTLADAGELPLDVYFCFTVREEIGVSGALTAANTIRPDYAIVLETTAVADLCDVDESMRVASLGSGGAISLMDRSTIYNRDFIDLALEVAKKNEIPVQVKKYVSGGNDAGHIHKSTTGVKTLALSAPTRYLHSPNCVACYDDYEHMLKLLQKLILTGELR